MSPAGPFCQFAAAQRSVCYQGEPDVRATANKAAFAERELWNSLASRCIDTAAFDHLRGADFAAQHYRHPATN
jgi:hypothetical protein